MDHPFRSAAFGGFNRQDVLDYFEKMAAENNKFQQELQAKLEESQQELQEMTAKVQEQEQQLAAAQQEREDLQKQLEQFKRSAESGQVREENQRRQLAAANQELDSLKARVAALEPEAAAYGAIKDRTAGVELEAHCRAQGVLDQAGAQAQELRRNMEQWMGRVEQEYGDLRSQVESTISHAADQLEKAGKCMEKISAMFASQEMELESISRAYDSTAPDKVPAPMPLNENED